MQFGEWLLKTRKEQGLTLAELGERAKTSKSYVYDVENLICQPSLNKALMLAAAVGFDLWDVLKELGTGDDKK